MTDEPITIQEGSGFYTDESAWPQTAEHGNGTYGPRTYASGDGVNLDENEIERAREDADFVNELMGF